ncbi:Nucleolar complex-associated protein 3 [Diplonema papillatum]|nr:Nucleolar complex-associated protein 3 [Diplonema papillatum]
MERNYGDSHGYSLGRIKDIRAIHKRPIASVAEAAQALRDEASVYVDILPGYKIKELTEDDKQTMKSKDVRALQNVEQSILQYYRKFLGNVVALAHKKSGDAQFVAVSCLCEILSVAQHFNFGSSVIDIVVDKCNSRIPRLANMCVAAVRELLSSPTPSDSVLSCLQCISDSVKDRGHSVNHRLIGSLLCVRIKLMDIHSRDLTFHKKVKQKQKKEDKELAKQLAKAEASLTRVDANKLQTKMLNKVLTTYLRALEICKTAPRYRQSLLLGPTMEGLAKFAHMIDFSLFELLLTAIGDIIESGTITTAAILNGIITVATLANQVQQESTCSADSLSIDIAPYYEKLYEVIPLAVEPSNLYDERTKIDRSNDELDDAQNVNDNATSAVSMVAPKSRRDDPPRNTLRERTERASLLLKACDMLLLQPKKVSMQRVSAFFRRLELQAAHAPPHVAAAVVAFNHKLVQRYPSLAGLHDGNGEESAGGSYDPFVDTPDHVNAMSSTSWELCLLRSSYHPFLREYAATVLNQHKGTATNVAKASSMNSTVMGFNFTDVKKYDNAEGGFNPLPQSSNKKMDRGVLKRHREAQQAAAALSQAELMAEKAVAEPAPPTKKRKVIKPAAESG